MNVQIQPYLDFPYDDISLKLVEWIEISRALGADKIFLYQLDVHPNIAKVMTECERGKMISDLCRCWTTTVGLGL